MVETIPELIASQACFNGIIKEKSIEMNDLLSHVISKVFVNRYELNINFYDEDSSSSTIYNYFKIQNHMPFSTKDRDQDSSRQHCSVRNAGSTGWWFNGENCNTNGGLNGPNKRTCSSIRHIYTDCIWNGYCLKESKMTIKRVSTRCKMY